MSDHPEKTEALSEADPKGLIREAFRIPEITVAECRSIFMDWALSLPEGREAQSLLPLLLEVYGVEDHPMTGILRDGLTTMTAPRRRGGFRRNLRN